MCCLGRAGAAPGINAQHTWSPLCGNPSTKSKLIFSTFHNPSMVHTTKNLTVFFCHSILLVDAYNSVFICVHAWSTSYRKIRLKLQPVSNETRKWGGLRPLRKRERYIHTIFLYIKVLLDIRLTYWNLAQKRKNLQIWSSQIKGETFGNVKADKQNMMTHAPDAKESVLMPQYRKVEMFSKFAISKRFELYMAWFSKDK